MRERWVRWTLIVVALSAAYGGSFSFRPSTDTLLLSLQTRALVLHGDIDLARYGDQRGHTFERNGSLYALYGIGTSVVAAPAYAVLVRLGASEPILHASVTIPAATLAVILLFVALQRRFSPAAATVGAATFAFGTTFWPTATTALWQQAPAAALQAAAILALFARRGPRWGWMGAALGASIWMRPQLLIPVAALLLYAASRGKRALLHTLAGMLPFAVAMVVESRWVWGRWSGSGYANIGIGFQGNVLTGLEGQLFSWWRGLFVYSPILVLAVLGWLFTLRMFRREPERLYASLGLATVVTIMAYAAWEQWWGGFSQFGYRLLLDTVPFMIPLVAFAFDRLRNVRGVALGLLTLSIASMAAGAAPNTAGWERTRFPASFATSPLGLAWDAAIDSPGLFLARFAVAAVAIHVLWWAARQPRSTA